MLLENPIEEPLRGGGGRLLARGDPPDRFLQSLAPRRVPFNEHGLFRNYPELDQPK